ncbi:MAG: 2-oxoacid:acceptor oxidoreductase family protein, partial [Desulfosarcina sp.]
STYQIVISGVGGQGVLFVTRLLAEAAILKGLPVFTSETHGMAQRGGTVISYLKVGGFASPLIRPGRADGLIALKAESLAQHGGYLKPDGWAAVNRCMPDKVPSPLNSVCLDADRLAREIGNPRSVNLIMLGFTLSMAQRDSFDHAAIHCSLDDVTDAIKKKLKGKGHLLASSLRALTAGAEGLATE